VYFKTCKFGGYINFKLILQTSIIKRCTQTQLSGEELATPSSSNKQLSFNTYESSTTHQHVHFFHLIIFSYCVVISDTKYSRLIFWALKHQVCAHCIVLWLCASFFNLFLIFWSLSNFILVFWSFDIFVLLILLITFTIIHGSFDYPQEL